MYTDNNKNDKNTNIKNNLDNFLSEPNQTNNNTDCKEEVCYVNDGKEIVERIEKKLVTNDGRRLLI